MTHFLASFVGLIALGSFFFWPAVLVPIIILTALVENEKSGWAGFITVATLISFFFLLDQSVVQFALHHIIQIVAGFVKWWFFILKVRDVYEQIRGEFLSKTKASTIDGNNREAFSKALSDKSETYLSRRYTFQHFPPKARENKGRIIFWMGYWPVSAFWTLLNDPIMRLYQFVFRRLVLAFEAISKTMFKKYAGDFPE
jgi:hypothetical protein